MSNLLETLYAYIKDPENPELNFQMALHYEVINQTASAISYFLRCAERTDNDKLAYECLCKIGLCFERQGKRGNSARHYYQLALDLLPRRPEAYYLLARYYERVADYPNAYMYGNLGEHFADANPSPLRTWIEYPGRWGLTFEKGVAAWWIGKSQESRDIWQYLKNEHYSHMDQGHIDAVQRNMCNLGCGPMSQAFHPYSKDQHSKLRFAFPGSETIDQNWSQVYQDLFILACLNGKRDGRYLEIGSAGPWHGNNTALLEKKFGWKGIGVEWDENLCKEYRAVRSNEVLHADALKLNYADICAKLSDSNGVIDYLQLDIEPARITYECMQKIPFDKYRFRVITYEHDHYVDITGTMREKSRNFLRSKGYRLLVNDMSPDGKSTFEDWWVHPDLIDSSILEVMDAYDGKIKYAPNYMMSGPVKLPPKKKAFPIKVVAEQSKKPEWKNTQFPTLEICTNIAKAGCVVDCVFCPQKTLIAAKYEGDRVMTMDNFKRVIDKLPKEIRITFAGFTEPFLNKHCTDMILHAHEQGHPVCVFTTAVGMKPEDVYRLKDVPYFGDPNGGFVLHLPDQEGYAKHPLNDNFLRTIEAFSKVQHQIQNFRTMVMSHTIHEKVAQYFPTSSVPLFYNRAGNLNREYALKPELMKVKDRVLNAPEKPYPSTCGCAEDLYHNVLLPNGDVSLCCMDYGLENILGNLYTQEYDDIVPKHRSCFEICRKCENGVPV